MKNILYCFFVVVWAVFITGCHSLFETPQPKLTINKNRVYIGVPPFTLKGGVPEGGIYSGNGVKNGKFYPEKAGTGKHTITYSIKEKKAEDTIEVIGPKRGTINPNCPTCGGTGKTSCPSRITCEFCNGHGKLKTRDCGNCDGTGRVRAWYKLWVGRKNCGDCEGVGAFFRGCTECKESGKLKCPHCKGTGKRKCPKCI